MATKKAAPKTPKVPAVEVISAENSMVKFDSKAARTALGLNQSQFWQQVFVTQSGGSRYENERNVPRSIRALLVIAYGPDEQAQAVFDHIRGKKEV